MSRTSLVPRDTYLMVKSVFQRRHAGRDELRRAKNERRASAETGPKDYDRDPRALGNVLTKVIEHEGWGPDLAQAQIVLTWNDIVGESIAQHTRVIGIQGGVLEVQCDSTSWAAQLRMLRGQFTNRIEELFPGSQITDIKVRNPGAPSWRHGSRRIAGRGPRDTYG